MVDIKKTKGDIVLGIWLSQKVIKCGIVIETDLASVFSIGDLEQNTVLLPLNLVLCKRKQSAHNGLVRLFEGRSVAVEWIVPGVART